MDTVATGWFDADMRVSLVFLGVGGLVVGMLGLLVFCISRWGE